MRTTLSVLLLFMVVSAHTHAAGAPSSNGFSKVELVQELPIKGVTKILGWHDGNYYLAKNDGSVSVVDKDGKETAVLQAKEGKKAVLSQPEAAAVVDNVIYIVDSETNRVSQFTAKGQYRGSFGAKAGGFFGKPDGLSSPSDIAIHEGIVYVADSGNSRIQLYGINGVFLATFEIDSAPENNADKARSLPYKLKRPAEIEVDAAGRVYVLDTGDDMIKMYSPNGAYLMHLPAEGKPLTFSMAADGIYVADRDSLTIYKYDYDGKQVYSFGSKGKGRAQFRNISGLSTGNGQKVLVSDSGKEILDVFSVETGTPFLPWVKQPSRTSVRWESVTPVSAGKIASDGKGTIYGVDANQARIIKIVNGAAAGEIRAKDFFPVSVAVGQDGALWALDKKKARVAKLDEPGNILLSIGASGSRKGEFDDAEDLAISSTGIIFVADNGNSRIQAFSSDGIFLKEIRNDASGKLDSPAALALDPQDTLYVLDKRRAAVSSFSAKGEPQRVFGKGVLAKPQALMATQDEVFVLDADQVRVFSHAGQYIRAFAASGNNIGELNEPVSIATIDDTTLCISDSGNKRLQTFTTLHKPAAPGQLAAQGAVRAVELNWTATSLPYAEQYQIFRSENENSGFAPIGTTRTNQYADQNLAPDQKYFYRVAGISRHGYAGGRSETVSASAQKYVPPAPANIQVAPSFWKIKMSWPPLESEYFSAYLIYQKSNGEFIKIGETASPEFIKESLIPDTGYTYYISTRSTDGTESDKVEVTATTLPFNVAPLEIEVIKLQDIFSNSYKLYEQNGIGRIRITNNTNQTLEKIKVTFTLNNFMDFPTEVTIAKLLPEQSEEITLKAVFNNNILTITEDSSIQTAIEAKYFQGGKPVVFSKNSTITVYDKHRMTWDEHDRVATFITPKDPVVMNFSRSMVTHSSGLKDETQLAGALFDAMGMLGLTYIPNPADPYQVSVAKTGTAEKTDVIDYVQYPRETLERKSGDCVDLVSLYTSALESMGIATLMVEVPDHLLMMFSTGINADADGYTMDDMYVIHDGKLWIPVEVTTVGKPFIKAWELGAKNYYQWKDKGLALLNIHDSWNTFKPATLPNSSFKTREVTSGDIEKKFPGDYMSLLKISSRTKTRPYMQKIEKDPGDMDAHLQMGIILAKLGDRKEAMKYFDKVLGKEPKNAAALNNRGNIFMLDEKFAEAQKAYLAASQASPDDPHVWVNLSMAYKAMKDTKKAKAAFVKAQRLDASVKIKHKAMALELLGSI